MTKAGRDYIKRVETWKALHYVEVVMATASIRTWLNEFNVLHITYILSLHRDDIFTQAGFPRKMDATNRIKILQDTLSKLLLFDDSLIFSAKIEKAVSDERYNSGVTIMIDAKKARYASDLLEQKMGAI
jgi:Holliday junction resolvase RusA-like endonuclease